MSRNNTTDGLFISRAVLNSILLNGKLNVCHINVQSLCARQFAKLEELKNTIFESKIDIACFTETWLDGSISDTMIEVNGFTLIRNDRNHGGGITVYIRKGLPFRLLSKSLNEGGLTEFLIFEVFVGGDRMLMAVYYNPPNIDCSDLLRAHFNEFSLNYASTYFIGDFNTDPLNETRKSKWFRDTISSMSYSIINSEPTFFYNTGSSVLDLLITDSAEKVLKFSQISMSGISKHDLIFASLDYSHENKANGYWLRDYNNFDAAALQEEFYRINWNEYFSVDDPDVITSILNNNLCMLHEYFFPLKFRCFRKNPWCNSSIEKAIIERDLAYRNWKRNKTVENKASHKRLRNKVNSIISKAKAEFDKQRLNVNLPCKQLWQNVKKLGITNRNTNSYSEEFTADSINEFFSSNFCTEETNSVEYLGNENGFKFRPVLDYEIVNAVFEIKSNAV